MQNVCSGLPKAWKLPSFLIIQELDMVQVLLSAAVWLLGELLFKRFSGLSYFADFVCTCLYPLFMRVSGIFFLIFVVFSSGKCNNISGQFGWIIRIRRRDRIYFFRFSKILFHHLCCVFFGKDLPYQTLIPVSRSYIARGTGTFPLRCIRHSLFPIVFFIVFI